VNALGLLRSCYIKIGQFLTRHAARSAVPEGEEEKDLEKAMIYVFIDAFLTQQLPCVRKIG
jgi:hypothetical protein